MNAKNWAKEEEYLLICDTVYMRLIHGCVSWWFEVGAPPEVASLLEEIGRERRAGGGGGGAGQIGVDPELDEFMVRTL